MFTLVVLVVAIGAADALARVAAPPTPNMAPVFLTAQPLEGSLLQALPGNWNQNGGAPLGTANGIVTRWERCDSLGAACIDLGLDQLSYTLTAADVDHTVRMAVIASNRDGSTTAYTPTIGIISSLKPPVNTRVPNISGRTKVGAILSATVGTWTGGAHAHAYQWQRCDARGGRCTLLPGQTTALRTVDPLDAGSILRVIVTATNRSGSTNAMSPDLVIPAAANAAPTLTVVAVKRIALRMFATLQACDEGPTPITVSVSLSRGGVAAATHRLTIPSGSCKPRRVAWAIPTRFLKGGIVTLQASDKTGAKSKIVSRSIA